ncbi:MAG: serine hydrolase [Patescibacteria group bacterium]
MSRILLKFLLIVLFGGLMFGLGWQLRITYGSELKTARGRIIRQGITPSGLVNPLLGCEIGDQDDFQELKLIKENLEKKIHDLEATNSVSNASLYLRTLNNGRWLGVNEDALYAPASMLKVIIMISYFKQAENNPALLTKQVIYTSIDNDPEINVGEKERLTTGNKYSIDKLIEHMIAYSDNAALNALLDSSDPAKLEETFTTLNLALPKNTDVLDDISAKQYSAVFRTLYSASYLNTDMSEKALRLLSKTTFQIGIPAQLPTDISVAHKFGIRKVNQSTELHDCGIIYYPEHPYFLCIMTKGANIQKQALAIQELSKLTYTELDTFFKNEK